MWRFWKLAGSSEATSGGTRVGSWRQIDSVHLGWKPWHSMNIPEENCPSCNWRLAVRKTCLVLSEGTWRKAVATQVGIRASSRSLFFRLSRLPEISSSMEVLVLAVNRSFWMNSASSNKCLLSSSSPPTLFLNISISCHLSWVQCQTHQILLKNTPLFCGKMKKMRGFWCFSSSISAPLPTKPPISEKGNFSPLRFGRKV